MDLEANKVVGIISEHYKSRYSSEDNDEDIYRTLSFAIPIESIIQVCPEIYLEVTRTGSGIKDTSYSVTPFVE